MHAPERRQAGYDHEAAWAVLPWYANGSLDEAERECVRAHVSACLVCTRELRRLDVLARALAQPAGDYACGLAYAKLSARLQPRRRGVARLWAALRAVCEPVPLVAGAALLIGTAVVAGAIVLSGQRGMAPFDQPFKTLGRSTQPAGQIGYPELRVVLRDEVDGATRAAWLARHGAELVDGPSAIGVMTVRVPLGPGRLDEVVAALRADAHTLFVEPVSVIGARPDRRR
ncbi:MAG: hypothetical protein KDK06_15975 [Gammaproteobacteria bacterium]|nr:hypothetical protein [Gammaproteobacteria bacterium]